MRAITMSAAVEAFLEHWRTTRNANLVPTVSEYVAALTPQFATNTFRAEVTTENAIILFLGSNLIARTGHDLTGQKLFVSSPGDIRKSGVDNLRTTIDHPCAFLFQSQHTRSQGGGLMSQTIILPLRPAYGALPQVVGFSIDLDDRKPSETVSIAGPSGGKMWISIGAGTPVTLPS